MANAEAGPISTRRNRTGVDRTSEVDAETMALISAYVSSETVQRLVMAAIECFWEKGFHASSTRDIAKRANLSPAAVYVHFKSKNELLFRIIEIVAGEHLKRSTEIASQPGTPSERLRRIVVQSIAYPCNVFKAATVTNSEFTVLSGEQREHVMSVRDQLDGIVARCLADGCAAGEFEVSNMDLTKIAIATLCRSVLTWYSLKGPLSPEEIGAEYADLTLAMVTRSGAPPA